MPRLAPRLKSLPSVALAVLACAWSASQFVFAAIAVPHNKAGYLFYYVDRGSLGVFWLWPPFGARSIEVEWNGRPRRYADLPGRFFVNFDSGVILPNQTEVTIPILWLMATLLPLFVGVRTRFRYSLRMWLAWIAIAAILCATTTYESIK